MGSLVWYLEMLHLRRDGSFSLRSQPAQVFYKWWFLQHHLLLWASVHISSYCPLDVYSSLCTKILQRILDTQLTPALWLNLHPLSNGLCSPTLLNLPWPCQYSPLCHIYRSWVKYRQIFLQKVCLSPGQNLFAVYRQRLYCHAISYQKAQTVKYLP